MSRAGTAGYDRQITIFSPEGRLYQVEYAFKAVSGEGLAAVGLRGEGGAVVISERKVTDKLFEGDSVTRLFRITREIGCVATGPIADSRSLVARARHEASTYAYKHAHPIPIDLLARRIGNLAQVATQEAGMRPMACMLTLIGIDEERGGAQVYKCDPAGFYTGYIGCAAGPKSVDLSAALEKRVSSTQSTDRPVLGATLQETLEIGMAVMASVLSKEFKAGDVEVGVVEREGKEFRVLGREEIEQLLQRLAEKEA